MPSSTAEFVSTLITNVQSFRPCANCGTLGFEPEMRTLSGLDK